MKTIFYLQGIACFMLAVFSAHADDYILRSSTKTETLEYLHQRYDTDPTEIIAKREKLLKDLRSGKKINEPVLPLQHLTKEQIKRLRAEYPADEFHGEHKDWDKLFTYRCFKWKDWYLDMKNRSVSVYSLNGKRIFSFSIAYGSRMEILRAWWPRRYCYECYYGTEYVTQNMFLEENEQGIAWYTPESPQNYLWAYAHRNYLFNLEGGDGYGQNMHGWSNERLQSLFHDFVRIQQGELEAEDATEALKQAKRAAYARQIRNTSVEIDQAVTYGLRSSVPFLSCGSSVRLREALNIPEEPMVNTIPNINAGVACGDIVDKLATGKLKVMETSGEEDGFKATLGSRSERIHYTIVHQFNRNLAINTVLDFRALDHMLHRWDHKVQTDQEVIKYSIINPGWVGDFDIATKARLGRDGAVVFGSEKSAIYFTRGNTAVSIVSENPYFNVLPMARLVDEELKKKLNIPPAKEPVQQPPPPQKRKP